MILLWNRKEDYHISQNKDATERNLILIHETNIIMLVSEKLDGLKKNLVHY